MFTSKYFSLLTIIVLLMTACNKSHDKIETTGTIQVQGITTYQYGTHTIDGYALRSSVINLNDHVGQVVTIEGEKIDGYPLDRGPNYIEVEKIK